jgi:hypothetical protein
MLKFTFHRIVPAIAFPLLVQPLVIISLKELVVNSPGLLENLECLSLIATPLIGLAWLTRHLKISRKIVLTVVYIPAMVGVLFYESLVTAASYTGNWP